MAEIVKENISISILRVNEEIANELRQFFNQKKIFVVNLISSPGSGKTMLIERLLDYFDKKKVFVFVGDIETEKDAKRIREKGANSYQIITGNTCHLEAIMIKKGLSLIEDCTEYLFIENVGNLVCPASYDLGEHLRISMISTPEGDDKILKYPKAFLTSDVIVINKIDLLKYLPFDIKKVEEEARKIKNEVKIFKISALLGEGVKDLADFIKEERERKFKN
ncbi:MAG: hydrogenase nickel incorporation protein HypB [Candidatus Hydrothermales bacterium]